MSRSGRRSGENSYEKAVEELNSFAVVPQLVLFNPEGVFWESNSGADVVPYPEVPGILSALRFKGVRIGVVAHTQQPYLTSTALSRLTHESFSPMVSVTSVSIMHSHRLAQACVRLLEHERPGCQF